MKRERYFRDELRKLFISYAMIPSVLFTVICGLGFILVLVYGRMRSSEEQNQYAVQEMNRILAGYEKKLDQLSGMPELFTGMLAPAGIAWVYENFYAASKDLGAEAQLYAFDADKKLILSTGRTVPDYFVVDPDISWGIFSTMENREGENALQLTDGWKSQNKDLVMGRTVEFGGKRLGYLAIAINSSQFQAVLDRSEAQTILTDRFGWVYASSNYNFLSGSNRILDVLKGAGRVMTHDGHMYLVSRQTAYGDMMTAYTVSDIQNIVTSLTLGSAFLITALAFMTVWVLIRANKVTEKKTEDFYKILDVMETARDGNLDTTIRIESGNEFSIIADAYNEMILSLKRQMENNRRMAELVAVSQNRQLQSQFNPHFLYNTLENIRYMCRIEPEIASKMTFSLSQLLRYSLDSGKAEVPLGEDMEHLESYLTILKYRFNRRFSYQIDIEPEARACRIPKLILQPMIENAVKYGFGNQETLRVELTAYLYNEKLTMICRDDGVGIPQGTLSELNALLGEEENKSRHSGLYNIHRRIQILYGHGYGVDIRSTEGHGTMLVVTVPVRREETNAENSHC